MWRVRTYVAKTNDILTNMCVCVFVLRAFNIIFNCINETGMLMVVNTRTLTHIFLYVYVF